jgi:4-hydroxybutyrate CoA-transferase
MALKKPMKMTHHVEAAINTHQGKLVHLERLSAKEGGNERDNIYQSRVTTAEEAVKVIKSGTASFLREMCPSPRRFWRRWWNMPQIEGCGDLPGADRRLADYVGPEMEGHLRVNSMFISANIRKAVQEGRADFTPVLLSEFPLLFKRGILPVDVAIIHVSTAR